MRASLPVLISLVFLVVILPVSHLYSERISVIEEIYLKNLEEFSRGMGLMKSDNVSGSIVWGEQYIMRSFLDLYEATGSESYLKLFRTSIEIRGVHYSHNNYSSVEIFHEESGAYGVRLKNMKYSDKPVVIEWIGLDQDTVESRINGDRSAGSYIFVRRLGDERPVETVGPVRLKAETAVFSVYHSPFILVPFVRFACIVQREGLTRYHEVAEKYLELARTVYDQNEPYWIDRGEYGYYVIEEDLPYWAAGMPAPYNVQFANGLFILYLARVTGYEPYRERAAKIAGLARKGTALTSDGLHTIGYWFAEGQEGFIFPNGEEGGRPPSHYREFRGNQSLDDISHGSHLILFVLEGGRAGLFDDAYTGGWSRTAAYIIGTIDDDGFVRVLPSLNKRRDIQRTHKMFYALPTWGLLCHEDVELIDRLEAYYLSRLKEPTRSGAVFLGLARLAKIRSGVSNASR